MRAAIGIIAAGVSVYSFAVAQEERLPMFGTTVVVPGGLVGVVYHIPPGSKALPFFQALDPLGVIYTSTLNVPRRSFREGFPGVTDRVEWFAIDYTGRFWISKPGTYQFELTSDDGARLYLDDELSIDNDGLHPPQVKAARVGLSGGIHRIRVSYFQGPREEVALVLRVAGPDEALRIFSTDEFKPPPDPENWQYVEGDSRRAPPAARAELRLSAKSASPGEEIEVEISLEPGPGTALAGADWELVIPAQIVEPVGGTPEIGPAANGPGKSVNCSIKKAYLYRCVLAGDQPVGSGPIAIFHFKIRADAPRGITTFRMEQVEALTVERRRVILPGVEGSVAVH